jgi:hypothetical protein
VIGAVVAAAVLAGGAPYGAVSSIPDSAGVIHGCYDSGGNVKVIDTSVTTTCPKGYTSLNWNQQGPRGLQGNTVLNGTGVPSASAGNAGEFYIDTSADVLYGPKTSSGWPATGTSLVARQERRAKPARRAAWDCHLDSLVHTGLRRFLHRRVHHCDTGRSSGDACRAQCDRRLHGPRCLG